MKSAATTHRYGTISTRRGYGQSTDIFHVCLQIDCEGYVSLASCLSRVGIVKAYGRGYDCIGNYNRGFFKS